MKQWTCVKCCEVGHTPVRTCTVIVTFDNDAPSCPYPKDGHKIPSFLEERLRD